MSLRSRRAIQREFSAISTPYLRLAVKRGRREARAIVAWIRPRRAERALDAACGPARLARAIAPHVTEVHALDLCPRMIEAARGLPWLHTGARVLLALGDIERLPYRSRSFDLVVSSYAFANLPDPLKVLQEFARVVDRDGRIAIVDVVAPENRARRATLNRLEALRSRLHTRILSASEFHNLFKRAGLRLASTCFRRRRSRLRDWLRLSPAAARPSRAQTLRRMMVESMDGDKAGLDARRAKGDILLSHTTGWFLLRP